MELNECKHCHEEKPFEEFYYSKKEKKWSSYCKKCVSELSSEAYWKAKEFGQPGVFMNDEDKENVHKFLRSLGWRLNEENGVWYKYPVKNKQGEWKLGLLCPQLTKKRGRRTIPYHKTR